MAYHISFVLWRTAVPTPAVEAWLLLCGALHASEQHRALC